jgi:hypothetical protein
VFKDADENVLVAWRIRLSDDGDRGVEELANEIASRNSWLRVGFEDADLWLFAADRAALLDDLPDELTWSAAPDADFGYGESQPDPAKRRILCPQRR